jgi:hypothetical protein
MLAVERFGQEAVLQQLEVELETLVAPHHP